MRSIPVFALAGFVLSAAPGAAQRDVARPALTPTAGGQLVLADVSSSFDRMEKNIELQYAKLKQEAKNNQDALQDKIKEIDKAIERLKQVAKRIELLSQKIQELLPRIVGAVGSDSGAGIGRTPSTTERDRFAAMLAVELAKAGIGMSADQLQKTAEAIGRGGQGAMALAVYLTTEIAEANADKSVSGAATKSARGGSAGAPSAALQSLAARQDFPRVSQGDVASAAQLPGSAAASYFANRFSGQAAERLAATNKAIDSEQQKKKALVNQVAALEKEIAKLEQDRQKALADLRSQRMKAVRTSPTATPTPKK
jgi:predicted  nucleic acid-binding Zn-ribbon protein